VPLEGPDLPAGKVVLAPLERTLPHHPTQRAPIQQTVESVLAHGSHSDPSLDIVVFHPSSIPVQLTDDNYFCRREAKPEAWDRRLTDTDS
jgi:hypothetical protein